MSDRSLPPSPPPHVRSQRGGDRLRPAEGRRPWSPSLRARVLSGYLVMLTLFVTVFVVVVVQLERLQDDLRLLSHGYLPLSQELAGVASWSPSSDPSEAAVERLYRERRVDAWIFKRIEGHLAHSREIADGMLAGTLRSDDATAVRFILAQLTLALGVIDQLQDTHALFVQAVETEGEARRFVPELQDLQRQLDINLRILSKRLARRVARVVERTQDAQRDAAYVAGGVSAVAFASGLLLLFGTHLALLPIRALIAGSERIRAGRFDERVPEATDDEIGRLARSFNAMAASIEERERVLAERGMELERALLELQASQDRLIRTERLAAIGHMAAQIAHEVRNPLNALGLNADLLGEEIREGNPQEATELLAAIRREIRRLTDITEAYLSVGRLPPLRLEPQGIGPIVEELVRFQREELGQSGVVVDVRIDGGLPDVRVDADQLRQALLNILRNAGEALAGNGGGRVTVSASREGDALVRIDVADDGPGMAPEHVARIFDPFFSTKQTGSGLGLPLTQQVVTEHGGRIACISAPGLGTTFSIRLPAVPSAEPLPSAL